MKRWRSIISLFILCGASWMASAQVLPAPPVGGSAIGENTPVSPQYISRRQARLTPPQDYDGYLEDDSRVIVYLDALQAGDTVYALGLGFASLDPYLILLDERLEQSLMEDDDGAGGLNSALSYVIPQAGNYVLAFFSIGGAGEYRLRVGVNSPEVLMNNPVTQTPDPNQPFDCSRASTGQRPQLSGEVVRMEAKDFVIHYTRQGKDASTDYYVKQLREALEHALEVQLNQLGWRLPPSDCGEGGDARLDIYVQDLSETSAIGFASPENVVGDNPNTLPQERYAAYSYLIVENDMEFTSAEQAVRLIRATIAHELHHNIQFGYDINDAYFGFYEAGAVWMETQVFPQYTDAANYVPHVFANPDVCIGSQADDERLRIYAEWLMVDSFTRDLGRESYQLLWEDLAVGEGLPSFYEGVTRLGMTPERIIQRMAIRNLLLDYALANQFDSRVRVEANINEMGVITPRQDGVQQLAVDYVWIAQPARYRFSLGGGANLRMSLVGINQRTGTATVYELGQTGVVDTRPYEYSYLIIQNTARHMSLDQCFYSDWTLLAAEADEADPATPPNPETWDAGQFIPAG